MLQVITNNLTLTTRYHLETLMKDEKPINRILRIDLPPSRSAFLWGPRKTGKTTLLRQQFSKAFFIDLLDYDLFLSICS